MLRLTAAIVLALVATPALAEGKMWANRECTVVASTYETKFLTVTKDEKEIRCDLASWPISSAEAKLKCDDGSEPAMALQSDGRLIFAGIELYEVEEVEEGGACGFKG